MLKDAVARINEHICLAAARSGRKPHSVTLVAVSKGRPLADIQQAIEAGVTHIGENRVQEALVKYKESSRLPVCPFARYGRTEQRENGNTIRWHMIGHLQTNKVKDAVRIFDLIHSVDSLRLAEALDKEAGKIHKSQEVLIEVKTSAEATKYGVSIDEVPRLLREIRGFRNIRVRGLMTIAALVGDPEDARPYFRMLRKLYDEVRQDPGLDPGFSTLSMGMSDDFVVAIEEGSTMVRIGRALFEQ